MSQDRRLPIYLVLDCSESMAGTAIEAVNAGLQGMLKDLRSNPYALETAYLSVITFHREARQHAPLTEVMKFQLPNLGVRAGSSLGAALRLLQKCLQTEVVRASATRKGDYKPLVFLLTDGQPTDSWESAAAALRQANNPRIANIYAIGCGPDVDYENLREVTDIVLRMTDVSNSGFAKFFVWLSASISSASVKLEGGATAAFDMPPLPPGIEMPGPAEPHDSHEPRQVFLQCLCRHQKRPYLVRYALRPNGQYVAMAAHPLEVYERDGGRFLPPINTSRLDGLPDCPYCGNPAAASCECGAIACIGPREINRPVPCPACEQVGVFGPASGAFDVRRSGG